MIRPNLEINQVAKSYGPNQVLSEVSLTVPGGSTTSLLGPSGCGKTTLLRVIAGLLKPDSGHIRVGDRVLVDTGTFVPPEQRRIGMVFQDGALFPHMSVAQNVAYGLTKSEIRSGRVEAALAMVELAGFGERSPGSLSGGQAQRVALARALAPQPDLLLLDEPLSSLDAELRVRVRSDLVELLGELSITTVFVTHDQEEAFVVGDWVAVMKGGRIVQTGMPEDLYESPQTEWLAGFVGDANLLDAVAHRDGAMTDIGLVPTGTPLEGSGRVLVRPEYLQLDFGDRGVVRRVDFYGHDTAYEIDGYGEALCIRELRAPRFQVGDRVDVVYRGGPAVVFADGQRP